MDRFELAYRIPGKGSWKRKEFKTDAARQKFVDKLLDKEGSDVEMRFRDPEDRSKAEELIGRYLGEAGTQCVHYVSTGGRNGYCRTGCLAIGKKPRDHCPWGDDAEWDEAAVQCPCYSER